MEDYTHVKIVEATTKAELDYKVAGLVIKGWIIVGEPIQLTVGGWMTKVVK